MSYLTLEVEVDHGRVVAKEPGQLPEKGCGLLTILQSDKNGSPALTPLEALDALRTGLIYGAKTHHRLAGDKGASVSESRTRVG